MRTETQSQRKGITNLTIFPSSRWWRKIVNRLQKKDAVKRLCCFNGSEIKVRVDAITLGTGSLLEKYEATLASVKKHRLKYQFGWAGCCNKRRQFDPPVAGNELVNKNRLLACIPLSVWYPYVQSYCMYQSNKRDECEVRAQCKNWSKNTNYLTTWCWSRQSKNWQIKCALVI